MKTKNYSIKFNGSKFDCDQLFQKGLYYLYQKNKIVYVGMARKNVMDRILKHYNEGVKKFDSYLILLKPDVSERELMQLEIRAITKHIPIYNKVHNETKRVTEDDYDTAKKIIENCAHDFFKMKTGNFKCRKCCYELKPSKSYLKKQEQKSKSKPCKVRK